MRVDDYCYIRAVRFVFVVQSALRPSTLRNLVYHSNGLCIPQWGATFGGVPKLGGR